jgi:Protein of unknown function (DUF2934)
MKDKEERIRIRAHQIWEREGRQHGQDQRHWEQARREIEDEEPTGDKTNSVAGPAAGDGSEAETTPVSGTTTKRRKPRAKKPGGEEKAATVGLGTVAQGAGPIVGATKRPRKKSP